MDPVITITETLIRVIRGYLFAGLLFSLVFVIFGVQRVDPGGPGMEQFRLPDHHPSRHVRVLAPIRQPLAAGTPHTADRAQRPPERLGLVDGLGIGVAGMITSRRHAHLILFGVIGAVLPVVFGAGLARRPRPIITDDQSAPLFQAAGFASTSSGAETSAAGGMGTGAEGASAGEALLLINIAWAQDTQDTAPALIVTPSQPLQHPDLLVYWSTGEREPTELSGEARLLGQLAGGRTRRFPLDSATARVMATQKGFVVLYSGGERRLISATPLPDALRRRIQALLNS